MLLISDRFRKNIRSNKQNYGEEGSHVSVAMICMIKESGTQTVLYQDVFMDPAFTDRRGRREEINRYASIHTLNRLRKIVRRLLPHAILQSFWCSDGDQMIHPRFI